MPPHSKKGRIPHEAPRRGRAGETNNVPGKECFYKTPAKCPDDFFGLQLTAPSSSISRDFKKQRQVSLAASEAECRKQSPSSRVQEESEWVVKARASAPNEIAPEQGKVKGHELSPDADLSLAHKSSPSARFLHLER